MANHAPAPRDPATCLEFVLEKLREAVKIINSFEKNVGMSPQMYFMRLDLRRCVIEINRTMRAWKKK